MSTKLTALSPLALSVTVNGGEVNHNDSGHCHLTRCLSLLMLSKLTALSPLALSVTVNVGEVNRTVTSRTVFYG